MPSASDELRAKMREYFGDIDDGPPLKYLLDSGWTETSGILFAPDRPLTDKEGECINFLCDEWDYGWEAAE